MLRFHRTAHITGGAQVTLFVSILKRMTAFPSNRIAASFASQQAYAKFIIVGVAVAVILVSAMAAAGAHRIFGGALAILMLAVVVTDARFFLIPNGLTGAAFALGLLNAGIDNPEIALEAIASALLRSAMLAAVFLALRAIYRLLRGREGMGLGDVKLAGVAGVWLDWLTLPIAVEIAALSALAIYALRQVVLGRSMKATAKLPFGVFFAPAIWAGWLIEVTLIAPL